MRKRSAKTPRDSLAVVIESAAALRNLSLEEVTDVPGKRAWKLTAGSQIATEISAWGDELDMTCMATPIVFREGYAVYMPSDIKIESDESSITEWMTQAIVISLERADALLEILNGIGDAIRATGYRGKIKELAPTQRKNDLTFSFMVAETRNDRVFSTEIGVGVHESGFSCRYRMRMLGHNGGMPIFERELIKTRDPGTVLESIGTAMGGSREAYEEASQRPQLSEAYQRLLRDPRAFDGKVLLMVPRAKST